MRRDFLILIVGLLVATAFRVSAQDDPVINYFPLEVGNAWVYFDVLYPPPDFEPDTTFFDGRGVFAEIVIHDSLFFDTAILPGRWISLDLEGKMWTYIDGMGRILLLDFTLEDGTVVVYGPDHPIYPDYTMTVSKGGFIDTHIGRFENTMTFTFDTLILDADFEYTFAPSVGVVQYYTGHGQGYQIYSAFVGGAFVLDVNYGTSIPESFTLLGNYPNPFNPSTTITYTLPRPSDVQLQVFDLLGKRVRLLDSGFKPSGEHEVTFDATGLSTGIYFYTLKAGAFTQTRKMVVLK